MGTTSFLPEIINLRRVRQMPDGVVIVDRTTQWGNPYKVGRDGTREEVVRRHADYIDRHPHLRDLIKRELRGKVLACWCDVEHQACHAVTLWRIANEVIS